MTSENGSSGASASVLPAVVCSDSWQNFSPSSTGESPVVSDGLQDLRLWVVGWKYMLVASLVGAIWIFTGLLLLGLGERLLQQDERLIMLRAGAWLILYHFPFHLVASNMVGFLLYGLVPGSAWWMQLFVPGTLPSRLVAYSRERGLDIWRVAASSMVLHYLPLVLSVLLMVIPIGRPAGHFGLGIVYGIGGPLTRPMFALAACTVLPTLARSGGYFRGALASIGFSMIGFCTVVVTHSVASLYFGVWPDIVVLLLLMAYEGLGVFLYDNRFVRCFVADSHVCGVYAGTSQGMFPSLGVAMLHGNAEAARMALLIKSVSYNVDTPWITLLVLSICLNVANRTGWLFRVLQWTLGARRICLTNMINAWNHAKFKMGYPRFLALASVMLARVALGQEPLPDAKLYWVAGGMLLQEVTEDALVFVAGSLGLDAFSRIVKPEWHGSRTNAWESVQPCPLGVPEGDLDGVDVVWASHRTRNSHESQASTAALQKSFAFKYGPAMESSEVLPLWAHFVAIFVPQFHLVLCLALTTWDMPVLLGLCSFHAHQTECLFHGLLWWPTSVNC